MHLRQNDGCTDRIVAKRGSCTDCGGVLLPAGYGFADRAGSVFEVVCRSCRNRSVLRSGDYASAPCKSDVLGSFAVLQALADPGTTEPARSF